MAVDLPAIPWEPFSEAIAALSPEPLSEPALAAMYAHYLELRRWSPRLNLVGSGAADAADFLERHFGESLAALPLLPRAAAALDLGSGAGFPGLVLAAARPEPAFTLVEARERKWAFLQAAARRAALPCRCLNARVAVPLPSGLPETIGVVTARALRLEPEILAALARRLQPAEGRILLWVGGDDPPLPPALSPAREIKLPGSERRRILELRPAVTAEEIAPRGSAAAGRSWER